MPLSIALTFSLSQHLSEFSLTGSRACYGGLLRTLRAHPRLKFNLYLSGTLVHALNWLDPDLLAQVRAGAERGQFELLAGPYASNVPCAADDWDNAKQIALQREATQAVLGVGPAGFWNPGRGWRQSLAPVIADAGCRWTLVEDHLLHQSGAQHPFVFTTQHAGRRLTIFYDDAILRARVRYGVWTGRFKQAFNYLQRMAERPESRRFCLACAEEAEAMGLWSWQAGLAPQQVWANLDAFLTQLEAEKWLKTVHLSRAPGPAQELTPIQDGNGAELDRALAEPGAANHEEGYADWPDFIARAPKIRRFNGLYSSLRGRIRRVAAEENPTTSSPDAEYTPPPPTRSPLLQQAIHTLCAHQYRFGFPGVGATGYRGWEGARAAFVLLRAAELAAKARTGLWIEDANGDGADEILLCDGRQLAVVTPTGARLLFWFDLAAGVEWIGNQLAVTDAPFQGDSLPPQLAPRPREWLPETDRADLGALRRSQIKEAPPTRLGKYLSDWVWEGAARPVTWHARPGAAEETVQPLRAGQRALNDRVRLSGGEPLVPGTGFYRIEGEAVAFSQHFSADVVLVKKYSLAEDGVRVHYRVENRADEARDVELRVASELCPDYMEALNGGRAALEYVLVNDANPGVRNTCSGRAVVLAASRPAARLERQAGLFALEVALTFDLALAAQSAQMFEVTLSAMRFQVLPAN